MSPIKGGTSLQALPSCAERLSPHPDIDGAWLLLLNDQTHPVTFNRTLAQQRGDLSLLTWANPLLDRLLQVATSASASPTWSLGRA